MAQRLIEKMELHDTLNPKLWENNQLRPEVEEKLDEIVDQFILELQVNEIPIKVLDARLVGSNASFNYADNSDLDVHIVANFEDTSCDVPVLNLLYNYFKKNFNDKYQISIHGVPVELYVEDINSSSVSNGVYSLYKKEWIKFPEPIEIPDIDITDNFTPYKEKYEEIMGSPDVEKASDLIDELYLLRKDSISTDGEYGEGNLVFKEFRNRGYLDNLKQLLVDETSKELSLESLNESNDDNNNVENIKKYIKNNFNISTYAIGGPFYILSNGLYLNLGKNGSHLGLDDELYQNEIIEQDPFDYSYSYPNTIMVDLFNAIRCSDGENLGDGEYSNPYIQLPKNLPTNAQINSLDDWINSLGYNNKLFVDGVEYNLSELSSEYIIKKIKRYYSSGKLYESSNSEEWLDESKYSEIEQMIEEAINKGVKPEDLFEKPYDKEVDAEWFFKTLTVGSSEEYQNQAFTRIMLNSSNNEFYKVLLAYLDSEGTGNKNYKKLEPASYIIKNEKVVPTDGRNRAQLCILLDIDLPVKEYKSENKLNEGRDAPLYHATSIQNLINILNNNTLKTGRLYAKDVLKGKKTGSISLTRSKEFANRYTNNGAILILDQSKLINNYKLTPVGDNVNILGNTSTRRDYNSKAEEVIEKNISPLNNYLLGIEINLKLNKESKNIIDNYCNQYNIPVTYTYLNEEDEEKGDWGYHYGDLGNKADRRGKFGSRGSGGFGTGTYFVGTPISQRKDGSFYRDRPEHIIDVSKYNLFRPRNNEQAYKLHDALLAINNMADNFKEAPPTWRSVLDEFDKVFNEYYAPLNALDDDDYSTPIKLNTKSLENYIEKYKKKYYPYELQEDDNLMDVARDITDSRIKEAKKFYYILNNLSSALDYYNDDNLRKIVIKALQDKSDVAPSTLIMKALGYEGIDVRHLDHDAQGLAGLDNFKFGSVIYDLKESVADDETDSNGKVLSDDINESVLEEDIEGMKKYYKNIPDDKFQKLIELDPTYKNGSNNAGTYGKWILGLANKNNGKLDNIGHITDVIKRFDQNKKHLKNKDIMQFKSVKEVDDYLNNDDNYNELTDRQKLRQTQKNVRNTDVDKDATKVFENSMWEVWVPNTYEASCKLGQGTEWCTATTSTRDYFDDYTRDGKLYININKQNGEKLQFHFESESFMDENDEEIDAENFFLTNRDLAKFYSNIDSTGIAKRMLMTVERRNQIKDGEVVYTQSDYDSGLRFAPISADVTGVIVKCKKVGKHAFENCNNISVVVLEEGVEEIEEDAFAYCGYVSMLYIPSTLKLIGDCFIGTTIGNLHIPSIEAWNNVKFISVNSIPNGGNLYIGDSLMKNLIINADIKEYCFNGFDSIETVEVEEGVTKIGNGAFTGCKNLITVKLPSTLKEIKNFAFFGCEKLSNINIPESVVFTEDDMGTFSRSGIKTLFVPGTAKRIPSRFCTECTKLKSVFLGEGIDYIGRDAFKGCSSLNSIYIPKSVKTILPGVFRNMNSNFTIYCEIMREEADSAGYHELLQPNFYYHVVFGAKREQSN